jgi:biopolymer transport protein ExbD
MKKIIYVAVLLAGCISKSSEKSTSLSFIVLTDTIIAYQGNIDKNTVVDRLPFNEKNVKTIIISRLRNDTSNQILIKPAAMGNAGGNAKELTDWCTEIGFRNNKWIPVDAVEEKYFGVTGMKWDPDAVIADMEKPNQIQWPENESNGTVKANAKTYTILLLAGDKIYIYEGPNFSNGIISSDFNHLQAVRTAIMEGKKKYEKEFNIIIKSSNEATYKNVVNMLDEMTIGNIERYKLVSMSKEEIILAEKLKFPLLFIIV